MIFTQKKLGKIINKITGKPNRIWGKGCFGLIVTYDPLRVIDPHYNINYIKIMLSGINQNKKFCKEFIEGSTITHSSIFDVFRKQDLPTRGTCYQLVYKQGGSHFIRVLDHVIYDPARGLFRSSITNFLNNITGNVTSIICRGQDGLQFLDKKEVNKMSKNAIFDDFYEKAVKEVIKFEGGWVNNPSDPGGETVIGICRKFWPSFSGWSIVDSKKINRIPKLNKKDIAVLQELARKEVYTFYRGFESNMKITNDYNAYATLLFFSVHAGVSRANDACLVATSFDDIINFIATYYSNLFRRKPEMLVFKSNFETRLSLFARKKVKIK